MSNDYGLMYTDATLAWVASVSHERQLFMLLGATPLIPLILAYTAFIYWNFRRKVKLENSFTSH